MLRLLAATALAAAGLAAVAPSPAPASRPLRTAVFQPALASGSGGTTEFARIRASGASLVRIVADWRAIAPARPPAGFDAADPDSSGYDWSTLDELLVDASAAGLEPILDLMGTPVWAAAGKGVSHPGAVALGAFAHAIAAHYDGATAGLPRVRYWQIWNEPNLNTNLEPQFHGTTPASPAIYRAMLVAFATGVKAVDPSNVVILAGLAPYGIQNKGQPINNTLSVAPMTFIRDLLCVSGGRTPHATCSMRVPFDVMSVHPYTWGGPTHKAYSPEDVAIGNLPAVQTLLRTAWRLRRIASAHRPPLWVTEFSWDTNPPDPKGLPLGLQARWTSEALYRMWADGVAVVTWFLLRDERRPSPFQSGLYFAGATLQSDRPKPTLTAFRFPFVALAHAKGTLVWGRTPTSAPGTVRIERRTGAGWRLVSVLHAGSSGIFQRVLPLSGRTGSLRAHFGTSSSLPFGLAPVADRRISPFGS